jgi:hypothetical protein
MSAIRLRDRVRLGVVALLFLAAPTAGDIGSCNQKAEDLNATKFFENKQALDCDRCFECRLTTAACLAACGPATGAFPEGCFPLVHDGEVCLDALLLASCEDYASFMDDVSPTTPTECDFCPVRGTGGAP